jgi:hypothetical protein
MTAGETAYAPAMCLFKKWSASSTAVSCVSSGAYVLRCLFAEFIG